MKSIEGNVVVSMNGSDNDLFPFLPCQDNYLYEKYSHMSFSFFLLQLRTKIIYLWTNIAVAL